MRNALENFRKYSLYCDTSKPEKPRKTSERDDNAIRKISVGSPTNNTNRIRSALLREVNIINERTIILRLSLEFELKSRKPARKP